MKTLMNRTTPVKPTTLVKLMSPLKLMNLLRLMSPVKLSKRLDSMAYFSWIKSSNYCLCRSCGN